MRCWRTIPLASAILLACGGGPRAQTFPHHRNADLVVFVTFGDKRPAAFDPRSPDPRVHAAYTQLSKLVGHDIEFHFDDALVPKWETDFDALFAECIETVAADLAQFAHDAPEAFATAAPRLACIEVTYDATAEHEWSSRLDGDGNLRIVLTPEAWRLIPDRAVSRAILEADEDALLARYAGRAPEDVRPDEWPAYIDYLVRFGEGYDKERRQPLGSLNIEGNESKFRDLPRARVVLVMTRLADMMRDERPLGNASARARAYLLHKGLEMLEYAYNHDLEFARRAPPDSPWKRAETAWMGWLSGHFASLTVDERAEIMPHFYVRATYGSEHRFVDGVYPGFDAMGAGLGVFDEWIRAGHPVTREEGGGGQGAPQALFDAFVCPRVFRADGTPGSSPRACEHLFYDFVFDRPERREHFFVYVTGKKDPILATHVVANLGVTDAGVDLWQRMDADDATWRAAARVIADALFPQQTDLLLPEVKRLWRGNPGKRGALLYLVLRLDQYHNGGVDWAALPTVLGPRDASNETRDRIVGRDEFDAMLAFAPSAARDAWAVVPALSKGWSRVEVLVPYVERTPDMTVALSSLAQALCAEGNTGDLAKLRAYAGRRALEHPSEQRLLQNTVDIIDGCHPYRRPQPAPSYPFGPAPPGGFAKPELPH